MLKKYKKKKELFTQWLFLTLYRGATCSCGGPTAWGYQLHKATLPREVHLQEYALVFFIFFLFCALGNTQLTAQSASWPVV